MNRTKSLSTIAAAMLAMTVAMPSAHAAPVNVKVINTNANPVPVNGNVVVSGTANVNVTNASVPVTGTVSANINGIVPVTGSVAVTAMPPISVGGIPNNPFFGRIDGTGTIRTMGGLSGTIGLTSIIISNSTNSTQYFHIFNAIVSDPANCWSGAANVIGGGWPYFYVTIEPQKTTQFTFPTPLVFNPINTGGITCIAEEAADSGVSISTSGILP